MFALISALVVACGSDAAKSGPTDPNSSAGAASENAGAPGTGDVGGADSAGAHNSSGGNHSAGAHPDAGAGSGTKTGTVKLNLKVK